LSKILIISFFEICKMFCVKLLYQLNQTNMSIHDIFRQCEFFAHFYRYVSCVGQNKQHCSQKNQAGDSTNNQVGSGAANSGQHETPSGASQNSEAAIVALCIESVLLLCCFLFIVYLLRRQRFFTKSPANDPESARLDNALWLLTVSSDNELPWGKLLNMQTKITTEMVLMSFY